MHIKKEREKYGRDIEQIQSDRVNTIIIPKFLGTRNFFISLQEKHMNPSKL